MPSNGTWDQLLTVTQAKLGKPAGTERKLPITQIAPNPDQPRQYFDAQALAELAESIKTHGVLQPLLVRPHPATPGQYQIVAGERRWQASQAAGLKDVPVVVCDLNDGEALEVALVENVMREDISPLEEARSLKRLLDTFGYSYAKLGERLGKNKAYVDHRVRLLKMPDEIQEALERSTSEPSEGKLRRPFSPRHAGILSQIEDDGLRLRLIDAVFTENMSVSEAMRRKNLLKEVSDSLPGGESRTKLEIAVVDGLGDRDAKFRLAAFQASPKATAPAPERVALTVEVAELAVFQLIQQAQEAGGQADVERLLKALSADRTRLKSLLADQPGSDDQA